MNYNNGNYGRNFSPSFTIPRRNEDIRNQNMPFNASSVLNNAYGNIPNRFSNPQFKPYARRGFDGPSRNVWDSSSSYINKNTFPTPNNFFQRRPKSSANDINTSIGLSDAKLSAGPSTIESSSTVGRKQTYKESFGDLYNASLPKELLMLYQPLFCKLCMMQLTSNPMAKLHYKSKNHDKKVRKWLQEYSARTGEPLHPRAIGKRLKEGEEYDPKHYHCEVCDIELTGSMHAESHYMGKNHQRAVSGNKDPAGKGFYNDEGKWTKTVGMNEDKTGRDGFGQDFAKEEKEQTATKAKPKPPELLFRCEMCDIGLTSAAQLDIHTLGIRHKKKLKDLELKETIVQRLAGNEDEYIVSSETSGSDLYDPETAYRTPSGGFYCKTCDLALNSNIQFMQHLKSKKHKSKHKNYIITSMQEQADVVVPDSSDDIFSHL